MYVSTRVPRSYYTVSVDSVSDVEKPIEERMIEALLSGVIFRNVLHETNFSKSPVCFLYVMIFCHTVTDKSL